MVHSYLPKEKQTEFKTKTVIILKTLEHNISVQHQTPVISEFVALAVLPLQGAAISVWLANVGVKTYVLGS